MRTVVILGLTAGMALAQQAASPGQISENSRQAQVNLQAQREVEQSVLAQRAALQAQIATLKAEENASQTKLDELRKTHADSHPEVMALRSKLDELRSFAQGLQRLLDAYAQTSLKKVDGGLQTGLADRWWRNPASAQSVGLTADQQKKMDDVFQQYRLKLIDLNAALEKEEVTLEPLVAAETLDESRITAQIDRVAQARAELEKANGRMLLGIRKQLTPEQWIKLSQIPSQTQAAKK